MEFLKDLLYGSLALGSIGVLASVVKAITGIHFASLLVALCIAAVAILFAAGLGSLIRCYTK